MITLRQEQKNLVLDYFFQCGTDVHLDSAKQLIETDPRACDLYDQLKATLQHLDHVDHDAHVECPDHLADITVNKLKVASSAENARLQTLLAEEGEKVAAATAASNNNIKISRFRSFWQNVPDIATVACVLLIVASVAFPMFNHMRSKSRQVACSAGMRNVAAGIARYRNDNNSNLPAVATVAGAPWWKVGDQGKKNQSNTRHPWVLVKSGYVDAADFVCAGRKDGVKARYTKQQLQKLYDFESRQHISYSYMFMCDKRAKRQWNGRTVLMADLNPIFEGIAPSSSAELFEKLSIGDQLRNAMSSNHKKGQVILFLDGSAIYKKVRVILGDDIYTAKDKKAYTGCEVPSDIKDIFLVP